MYLFTSARFQAVWTAATLWISALILVNTTIYLRRVPAPVFLIEKGALADWPLWRTAFYFHVAAACVCLATGPVLMFPLLLRFRRLHEILGYVYLSAVLWVAAPTGLMLAPFAKGGYLAAAGFFVTGVAWWLCTWLGYRAIRNAEVQTHVRWMVRSYALALSAVAFRVIQLALDAIGLPYETNYILSIWISLLVSFWISETCIRRVARRRRSSGSTELAEVRKRQLSK